MAIISQTTYLCTEQISREITSYTRERNERNPMYHSLFPPSLPITFNLPLNIVWNEIPPALYICEKKFFFIWDISSKAPAWTLGWNVIANTLLLTHSLACHMSISSYHFCRNLIISTVKFEHFSLCCLHCSEANTSFRLHLRAQRTFILADVKALSHAECN